MNSEATRLVISELHKEDRMFHEAWQSISLDDVETFHRQAHAWLGDRSELSTATLLDADWAVVHAHFVAEGHGL